MKIRFLGPGDQINVGGLGRDKTAVRAHRKGEVLDYDPERARELLKTAKKVKFEKVK